MLTYGCPRTHERYPRAEHAQDDETDTRTQSRRATPELHDRKEREHAQHRHRRHEHERRGHHDHRKDDKPIHARRSALFGPGDRRG